MTEKYRVYLVASAQHAVEVEAEDENEAIELALSGELPYAGYSAGFELGDWTTPSELFPQWSKPEDDYEVIEE